MSYSLIYKQFKLILGFINQVKLNRSITEYQRFDPYLTYYDTFLKATI